jgi:hypothetical protein
MTFAEIAVSLSLIISNDRYMAASSPETSLNRT